VEPQRKPIDYTFKYDARAVALQVVEGVRRRADQGPL
jgi:hypothetical protein